LPKGNHDVDEANMITAWRNLATQTYEINTAFHHRLTHLSDEGAISIVRESALLARGGALLSGALSSQAARDALPSGSGR
jgi:hypothetical protein